MKTLFIGGPKDGKRENIPLNNSTTLQVASMGFAGLNGPIPTSPAFGITQHTYSLKKFITQAGEELVVAAHSTIPNMMEQLVKGYRYHRNPRHTLTKRKLSRVHNQLMKASV